MSQIYTSKPLAGLTEKIQDIVNSYDEIRSPQDILSLIINESTLMHETEVIKYKFLCSLMEDDFFDLCRESLGRNPYAIDQSVFDPETGEILPYQKELIDKVHVVKYQKVESDNSFSLDYVIDWVSEDQVYPL